MDPIRRCPTCGHQLSFRRGLLDDKQFDAFMSVAKGRYKSYWYKWRLYVGGVKAFISDLNIRTSTGKPLSRVYFSVEITKALKATLGLKGSAETLKKARAFSGHFGKRFSRRRSGYTEARELEDVIGVER